MIDTISNFNIPLASQQFDVVLAARRAGKIPHIFFVQAAEIDWLPVNAASSLFNAPLRPLLNESEMQDLVGIPIQTFDMAELPHEYAGRGYRNGFTSSEMADRFRRAGEILTGMHCTQGFIRNNQEACAERRGQAFAGIAVKVSEASSAQLEKQNRCKGEYVYGSGVYFSLENIGRSTVHIIEDASYLEANNLRYVPNTNDFGFITQLHELTHARQRQIINRPHEINYDLEEDADRNSFKEYLGYGGSIANVFTRLAARAVRHVLIPFDKGPLPDIYSFYPSILGYGLDWNIQRAHMAEWDLKLRIAAHSLGKKCDIQPNDMTSYIQAMLTRKPISDRKFIQLVDMFNISVRHPDLSDQKIRGFENLWHSGEKLHRDTLHLAGIAYEALDLFRNGPK